MLIDFKWFLTIQSDKDLFYSDYADYMTLPIQDKDKVKDDNDEHNQDAQEQNAQEQTTSEGNADQEIDENNFPGRLQIHSRNYIECFNELPEISLMPGLLTVGMKDKRDEIFYILPGECRLRDKTCVIDVKNAMSLKDIDLPALFAIANQYKERIEALDANSPQYNNRLKQYNQAIDVAAIMIKEVEMYIEDKLEKEKEEQLYQKAYEEGVRMAEEEEKENLSTFDIQEGKSNVENKLD